MVGAVRIPLLCRDMSTALTTPMRPPPAETRPGEVGVRVGRVIACRLFDIAYGIDLARAERVWAARPGAASSRSRLSGTEPKAVTFGVAPVVLALEPLPLELPDGPVPAAVTARLYDFGVVAFSLQIDAAGLTWDGFARLLNAVDGAVKPGADCPIWPDLLGRLRALLAPALIRPATSTLEEDYLIGLVEAFTVPLAAAEIPAMLDLVPLLSGEERPLSDAARADLLRQRFSYYADDLVVLTWDRAFIHEPRGATDVVDVLEVANAQLLEMRYYDELLDAELPGMYEQVEATRRTASILAARRYARLARRFYTLVAEVTELTERADNALQVIEDVYLARIYGAALELFRVRSVGAAVDRKLAIIRDTYAALYEEASSSRAELLEVAILLLIVVEIVLAVLRP
jgi:hypothetical protein